jgi:hypothetical protein
VDGNTITGRSASLIAVYNTLGTEANNDILPIGVVPAGARLLVSAFRVASEAVGGTTATVASLGTTTAANELSTTAIGITSAVDSSATPLAGVPAWAAPLSANTTVYAKLGLASGSFTANKKIWFRIDYILP